MPYEELAGWMSFFEETPPGWREDYRTFLMMRTFGMQAQAGEVFESLKRMGKRNETDFSGIKAFIENAKGGDAIDLN